MKVKFYLKKSIRKQIIQKKKIPKGLVDNRNGFSHLNLILNIWLSLSLMED